MQFTAHVGTKQKLCKWDQTTKKKGVNICFGSLGARILCDHSYSSTLNTLSSRLGDNALCQNCEKFLDHHLAHIIYVGTCCSLYFLGIVGTRHFFPPTVLVVLNKYI